MDVRIRIDDALAARFPAATVGGFVVSGLDPMAASIQVFAAEWAGVAAALAHRNVTLETAASTPEISAWRDAFVRCGMKPSTYRCSCEALVRRALKVGRIETPIPTVTAYCKVSATSLAPLGGYDADKLPGNLIELRFARAADSFQPLGGRAEDMPLKPTVAVYAVGDTVLCWLFNHRDSAATCLSPATRRAIFLGEAVDPVQVPPLREAMGNLADVLMRAGASVGAVRFVQADDGEVVLPSHHG